MGCLFEVMVWDEDAERCRLVAQEALAEVQRLDRQLSHYRDDSDISRLNVLAARQWVRVEPDLFRLLQLCAAWTVETDGAFDIAIGALLECWGFHRGTGHVADPEAIERAMASSGMDKVVLEPEGCLVHFAAPEVALNLGAVGKGYALDRAAATLRFYGVQSALLHGGQSTIVAVGAPPDAEAWRFHIRDPRDRRVVLATVDLRDAALSTSGNYEQYVEVNGMRYGHILDPRTGRPTQGTILVSASTRSAAQSDAFSTALFVLGHESASTFAERHQNVNFVMLSEDARGGTVISRAGLP